MKTKEWILSCLAMLASGSLLWLCQLGYFSLERLARIEEQTKNINEKFSAVEKTDDHLKQQISVIEGRVREVERAHRE